MNKIYKPLVLLLTISLCGCQPAPQRVTESSHADSDSTTNVSSTSEPDNTSEIIENEKTVIPETPSHIERSAAAGEITLTINADVSQFSAETLYLYDFQNADGIDDVLDDALVDEIIAVMGEADKVSKNDNTEYEFYLSDYPDEPYTLVEMPQYVSLRGHTDNLSPYGSNIYPDESSEILANYTRENAADK